MPKVTGPPPSPASFAVPDTRNARHLSCEGCSRTAPCVACTLRGTQCVWLDTKPSHGVIQNNLQDNQREIVRLIKVIDQLQNLIIEREGRPYFPPPIAPPTPPSYYDPPHGFLPPSHGGYYGRDIVVDSTYSTYDGPHPAMAPPRRYDPYMEDYPRPSPYPYHRAPPDGGYLAPYPSAGPYRPTSSRFEPYPQSALGFSAQPADLAIEPASAASWTLDPHARAAEWTPAGPVSFAAQQQQPPAGSPSLLGTGTNGGGESSPFLHPTSQAGLDVTVVSLASSSAAIEAADDHALATEILATLPKLDTDVALELPSTVSALLKFDAATPVGGAGELPGLGLELAGEGGKEDEAEARQDEQGWEGLVGVDAEERE
ncbi:hypothetical protein JCM8097_000379 [Rhodosporidiobolus ruineniae]